MATFLNKEVDCFINFINFEHLYVQINIQANETYHST